MILWLDLRLKETQSQIIIVSGTHSGAQNTDAVIPDWLRNNAAWLADDQIDDNTFANGIQFLIKNGIIVI